MRVVRELDAGPMFASERRPIGPDETSDALERDLAVMGGRLLVDVVHAIAEGAASEEPQDGALATYAPKITREDGLIDWSRPGRAIHDQVRGLYPWPHAYTFLDGARLIVLRTHVEPAAAYPQRPGTVVHVSHDAIHVTTGGEGIAIERLQPEGRRPMSAREYLAGRPLRPGARLGG
jgi:methionyl-tRNA formyltransferase